MPLPITARWTPRRSYVLALSLVAGLSVAAFMLLNSMIHDQIFTAQVINVSGRQRMLAERTTLFALRLTTTPIGAEREAIRKELRTDLATLLSAHSGLLNKVRAGHESGETLTALQTIYFGLPQSLDVLVQTHVRLVQTVLTTPDNKLSPDLPALQEVLDEGTGDLLTVLDAAVRIHQVDAEQRIETLRRGEIAVLAITLLTLLLEGLLIFRPLERVLQQRDQQLMHDAFHDPLTGLPNRALFLDRLNQAILRRQRYPDAHFAVLFIDCDRFKVINDTLGHGVGDALLIALAARLGTCIRGLDTVARMGGDEFTFLLENLADVQDAVLVAKRVESALKEPLHAAGHLLTIGVSIGVISSDAGHSTPAEVLRDADLAMYHAKARGRGRYEIFTPQLLEQAATLLNIELDLRGAQARGELAVHYQPVVSLLDGKFIGFEALLRWTHPVHGAVSPTAFIPVAEESGLIAELDRFVLRTACLQAVQWQRDYPRQPPLTMSVNVSGRHLQSLDLAEHVATVLSETGLAPHHLKLELTEGVLAAESDDLRRTMSALKALGVQLHIDDFGMGYSNLAYLQRFHANAIKIDRSFINVLGSDGEGVDLIASIVGMARSMHLSVVAEGVETQEQAQLLLQLGCEVAQGFLFSRPVPAPDAGVLLASEIMTAAQPAFQLQDSAPPIESTTSGPFDNTAKI
ncbi:putative bifunctional diguanylate cyclase/phosphodiesterase [Deinococcus hopiensis]|uniref:Diguanylate cyclase (GGDEF) domain-containing protein n=1 Tax=Deinococcus hopiensis KR-140 TaxID=695939 RepID=A0A1W1UYP7_9DEIO|nr:EAL domain-containing protein [Deinococcus hopiensis]SMB86235.1 diguanylate cyclase (GGDEF) domain-containing protein [Deinococcus hopiensis KR-140]